MPEQSVLIGWNDKRTNDSSESRRILGFDWIFLCAIVEEPTCFLTSNPSPASESSDRWRLRTSWRIFSQDVATLANHDTYSTYRSRPTTCVVANGTPSPRCVRISRCNSRAFSPCATRSNRSEEFSNSNSWCCFIESNQLTT